MQTTNQKRINVRLSHRQMEAILSALHSAGDHADFTTKSHTKSKREMLGRLLRIRDKTCARQATVRAQLIKRFNGILLGSMSHDSFGFPPTFTAADHEALQRMEKELGPCDDAEEREADDDEGEEWKRAK